MKKNYAGKLLRICSMSTVVATLALSLASFTANKLNGDFLKELGIRKADADNKIIQSILGGYLDEYGVKNAKNIALGNRTAVTNDLLAYTKTYVGGPAFKKEYNALKEANKPQMQQVKTPDEIRKETIDEAKKGVASTESLVKKADAATKPIFEKVLAENKKQLKEAEDPNNKHIAAYTKGYPQLLKQFQESYQSQLNAWENQYPANHLLFVKQRLQQFLDETKDIDFSAVLVVKGNKKIFVNSKYEGKSNRWKMAFRAGKEVVEPARDFASRWIAEIK